MSIEAWVMLWVACGVLEFVLEVLGAMRARNPMLGPVGWLVTLGISLLFGPVILAGKLAAVAWVTGRALSMLFTVRRMYGGDK